MKLLKTVAPFLLPLVFFVIALFTMYDYGMNWDGPIHYARGQAYLRYLVTRKENYNSTPQFCRSAENINTSIDYKTGEKCDRHRKVRVSEYESELLDYTWAKTGDNNGHPPASDILAAATNQLFYKKLGLIEDIPAYNLFHVFMTFVLASTVAYWAKKTYGFFASIIATLVIYLFPLLFAEQHINVKDPAMAGFFTLSLFFFWLSFVKGKGRYLFLSAVFGGLSFATKFNFMFAPFILAPWIAVFLGVKIFPVLKLRKKTLLQKAKKIYKVAPKRIIPPIIFYPFIIFFIFFGSWPILWDDPVKRIGVVFGFYEGIGVPSCPYTRFGPQWFTHCSNFEALSYILFTIPIISLFLFVVGSFFVFKDWKKNGNVTLLWMSFFLVTVLRVTIPIASIYGGIRQILEFIAPFALIGAVGAVYIRQFLARILGVLPITKTLSYTYRSLFAGLIILGCFIPVSVTIYKMHPNENLYFNGLIGGLKGAAARNFPGYGNTFGNGYYQAINWINKNTEKNAEIAMLFGNAQNISRASLRPDIQFGNSYISGYHLYGEYQIVLITQGIPVYDSFLYKYVDRFMNPEYTLSFDGIPILKIWKNDRAHIKKGISFKEKKVTPVIEVSGNDIIMKLPNTEKMKRIEVLSNNQSCIDSIIMSPFYIATKDNNYSQMYDTINDFTHVEIQGYKDRAFLFAGEEANKIKIGNALSNTCSFDDFQFVVYSFSNL